MEPVRAGTWQGNYPLYRHMGLQLLAADSRSDTDSKAYETEVADATPEDVGPLRGLLCIFARISVPGFPSGVAVG